MKPAVFNYDDYEAADAKIGWLRAELNKANASNARLDAELRAVTARAENAEAKLKEAASEICARCKPREIADGYAHYDCDMCKWRGGKPGGDE